ncbi:hypothetical protein DAEQUDRAFT_17833 [Daedalea quercina L-15889]|uniref:Uncharacterized protein n=1 Tax=Daedalea quercina L-15889 TaxID=1314783 RepID=A0A165UK00_9APHY|nr:hypothetical protein DAEQUDRAFT_17833 [Daedalea quercina L-15889]
MPGITVGVYVCCPRYGARSTFLGYHYAYRNTPVRCTRGRASLRVHHHRQRYLLRDASKGVLQYAITNLCFDIVAIILRCLKTWRTAVWACPEAYIQRPSFSPCIRVSRLAHL